MRPTVSLYSELIDYLNVTNFRVGKLITDALITYSLYDVARSLYSELIDYRHVTHFRVGKMITDALITYSLYDAARSLYSDLIDYRHVTHFRVGKLITCSLYDVLNRDALITYSALQTHYHYNRVYICRMAITVCTYAVWL